MEIKHDESYLYLYEDMHKAGFTTRAVNKLCFQGYGMDFENSKQAIQNVKDHLESNYKMYQYKKDNGVNFGKHELFYWCGDNDDLYFTASLNDEMPIDRNKEIVSEILTYIENNYTDIQGFVNIQYEELTDWNAVNNYVINTDFDINSLPFEVLRAIKYHSNNKGNTLTLEARDKLSKIEMQLLKELENKKVIYTFIMSGLLGNSIQEIKGTVKAVGNKFGIFKPRQTKTYYPFDMTSVISIAECVK